MMANRVHRASHSSMLQDRRGLVQQGRSTKTEQQELLGRGWRWISLSALLKEGDLGKASQHWLQAVPTHPAVEVAPIPGNPPPSWPLPNFLCQALSGQVSPVGGEDDGFATLPCPCHCIPEQTPGHGIHAGGGLIQEDHGGTTNESNASAQLSLVTTAAEGDGNGDRDLTGEQEEPHKMGWG